MADELTREKDFGRTDRYANKDGQRETEVQNAAKDTPKSAQQNDEDPDAPQSDVNRDE